MYMACWNCDSKVTFTRGPCHRIYWTLGSSFGIYGEQGAESIHAMFNSLNLNYRSMPSPAQRLRAMMKEHYLRVHPKSASLKPLPKKRKSMDSD